MLVKCVVLFVARFPICGLMRQRFLTDCAAYNKSLDASGGSAFHNVLGAAQGDSRRRVNSDVGCLSYDVRSKCCMTALRFGLATADAQRRRDVFLGFCGTFLETLEAM